MPGVIGNKARKKAPMVKGDKMKVKKLGELKKVKGQLDKIFKADQKRFEKNDKLFTKQRKLEEQLGIE